MIFRELIFVQIFKYVISAARKQPTTASPPIWALLIRIWGENSVRVVISKR